MVLFIIFPASLSLLVLDFLRRETRHSNSDLIWYRVVLLLLCLFCQMWWSPVPRISMVGSLDSES